MLFTKIILITLLSVANSSCDSAPEKPEEKLTLDARINTLVKKLTTKEYGWSEKREAIYGQAFFELWEHKDKRTNDCKDKGEDIEKEDELCDMFWNDKTGVRRNAFYTMRKAVKINTATQNKGYQQRVGMTLSKEEVEKAQVNGCGWRDYLTSYYKHLVVEQYKDILKHEAFKVRLAPKTTKDVAQEWEKLRVKETIQKAYNLLQKNQFRMRKHITSITEFAKLHAEDIMGTDGNKDKDTLEEFIHLVDIFIRNVNVEAKFLTNLRKNPNSLFGNDKNALGVINDRVKNECNACLDAYSDVDGAEEVITMAEAGQKAFEAINDYVSENLTEDFDLVGKDYVNKNFLGTKQNQDMSDDYKENVTKFHEKLSTFQQDFQKLVKEEIIIKSIQAKTDVKLAKAYEEVAPKGLPRVECKMFIKGDCRKIRDVIRGSVVFKSMADLEKAFKTFLDDHKGRVTRFKNRLGGDHTGYRDILVNLRVQKENTQEYCICELQFHHEKIIEFKEDKSPTGMHKVYEQTRLIAGLGYNLSKEQHATIGIADMSKLLEAKRKQQKAEEEALKAEEEALKAEEEALKGSIADTASFISKVLPGQRAERAEQEAKRVSVMGNLAQKIRSTVTGLFE